MNSKLAKLAALGLLLSVWGAGYSAENETADWALPSCVEFTQKVQVLGGDTLTAISQRMVKPQTMSDEQWMSLIYMKNPSAFIDGDVNRILEGEVLNFPCDSQIAQVAEPAEAVVPVSDVNQNQIDQPTPSSPQNNRSNYFAFGLAGLLALLLVVALGYIFRRKGASRAVVVAGESDNSALLDFLKRLVHVDLAIDDFARDGTDSEALRVIKALTKDVLDGCEVTTFSPKIGEDYRRAKGVAEHPKTRVTDKPEDKFKIAEVLEKGYKMKTPEGYEVIYPARVRILITD